MGLQQVVVLQTRQVLSLFLYNMLRISFGFCSLHFETNDRILMFVRRAETRFWNGIVCGTCGYLLYGQVIGDYVELLYQYGQLLGDYVELICIDMDKC